MIYLDNGATSFRKPPEVARAVQRAMQCCANPGRGGHRPAMEAANEVYRCREEAGKMFGCQPEQVVFTSNCTHGLNIAIRTLVKPGRRVVISGFEHNAVTRPLHGLGAIITVAGRKLFDWEDTLESFDDALKRGADAVIFTHVSNVFGYILPVKKLARLCRDRGVPFIIDAAQSAGGLPVSLSELGADFIAMPGHKGLLGPQGTGLLLCGRNPEPLLFGGTGSDSIRQDMPDFTPDRIEAGTLNVPGIAGLRAGLQYLQRKGTVTVFKHEQTEARRCAEGLEKAGFRVFSGEHQAGTVSFVPEMDCEQAAEILARQGIAIRAGLHCAPLAHESAGTLETGTVRVSFGHDAAASQTASFLRAAAKLCSSDLLKF
ncbi:MAG: aminotransferase class V-fold PLP-dependent enzyme [Oscillospiraceae bacterium]|nr:aminotransferase class V-fold PLP-dependent enzyme [Oscillospiraceae bacterium]